MGLEDCCKTSHFVFKYVEMMFWAWFNTSQKSVQQTYTGWGEDEPGVFHVKGAVRQAIENIFEEMEEAGRPVHIHACDVTCAFE